MRQSGKPRPVSPSEITAACLQDELANDDDQLRRGQVTDNGAPVPKPGGDIRQLFFLFFFLQGFSTLLLCTTGDTLHPM